MPSSHEVWGPDDCVWYNFALLNFLPSNTDLGVDYSKRQGIWVSSNKQQKWPRKQLNRAKRTTFAWIRQIHKFHMSSTETNQPLRTQRGQRGRQTDSLSWFLHRLHARCVLPNKDSETPTGKTHKKNSYKNTYNSHAAETTHMHAHTRDLQCVYSGLKPFFSPILHTRVSLFTNHVLRRLSIISRGRTGYKSLTKPPVRHAHES